MHDSLFARKPMKPGLVLLLLGCATANATSVAHDEKIGICWAQPGCTSRPTNLMHRRSLR
jgi:hypothetical protein